MSTPGSKLPRRLRQAVDDAIAEATSVRPNPRVMKVLTHLLRHGSITSEEIRERYGYDDPRRAIGDIRERGIPLQTKRVKGSRGTQIGEYSFDPEVAVDGRKAGGRRPIPKRIKEALLEAHDRTCVVCQTRYADTWLQPDHRIPVFVAGDRERGGVDATYTLLCRSCNRAKSWTCERICPNGSGPRDETVCGTCYWSTPDGEYTHVATVEERRVTVVLQGEEAEWFDRLLRDLAGRGVSVQEFVVQTMRKTLKD